MTFFTCGVRRTPVRACAASGALLAGVLAACGPNSKGSSQKCEYTTGGAWPSGAVVILDNPAKCPISTPVGGREQAYSTVLSFPQGTSTGGSNLTFYDASGNTVTQYANVTYTPANGGYYDQYLFVGRYTAGKVSSPNGADLSVNQVIRSNNAIATANVKLTYQSQKAAAVLGPPTVDPGASITLTGEYYQSDLVPPVSYQWYQNGSPIAGETGETLAAYGNSAAPWSSDIYEFRVTDSQGASVSAAQAVQTTAGCGSQIVCDGGGGFYRVPVATTQSKRP